MHLLMIITRSAFGGAQKYVLDLATSLSLAGVQVTVACQGGGPLVSSLTESGIRVIELAHMRREVAPARDVLALGELARIIRLVRPDIIHVNSSKAGVLGRVAGAICHTPVVYTVHGWPFRADAVELPLPVAVWTERLAAPLCARFIAPAHHEIEVARRFRVGRPDQFVCIPHGLDAHAPRAKPGEIGAEGLVDVCMVGRFERPKRQDVLIEAVAQVPHLRLFLVGDGEQQQACRVLAHQHQVADRVCFLGNRADVPDILAHMQIAALSSDMEALPITLLEAMRAGLPLLGTEAGGIPEVIEHQVTGYLGPKGEIAWLVKALSELADDPALREKMGCASRSRFERSFTVERMVQSTLAVYHEVLSSLSQDESVRAANKGE